MVIFIIDTYIINIFILENSIYMAMKVYHIHCSHPNSEIMSREGYRGGGGGVG